MMAFTSFRQIRAAWVWLVPSACLFAAAAAGAQPPAPAGPVRAAKVADPAPVSAPQAGGAPVAGDPLQDGMAPLPGNIAWPTVEATTGGDAETAAGDVRYAVEVDGLAVLGLQDQYRSLSSLWSKKGSAANLAQINRRVTEDRDLIDQLLRSVGYYGGDSTAVITAPVKASDPVKVAITVVPGPRYTFDAITITTADADKRPLIETALGLKIGDPVDATRVTSSAAALALKLSDAGYPFPKVAEPAITIDHASRTAQLTLSADPGPRGVFGMVRFAEASSRFSNAHLALLARLHHGDAYNAADVEDLRRAIIQTGLFGAVAVKPVAAGPLNADGSQAVDLVVTTEGAPLKTVATTIGYSTGQGVRAEASWQHRNFFKPEGALTVRGIGAEREQLLGVEVRRQNFRRRDQTLIMKADVSGEEQDAYAAKSVTLGASLERQSNIIWQKKWTYSIGAELIATRQRDRSAPNDPANTYYIAAFPGSLSYDGSDSLLDPVSGFRLTGRLSPEFSQEGSTSLLYAKVQVEGSVYVPVGGFVLAARGHLGSIAGASRGSIAPSRRFYAGGGGSVRGFGYQAVGPLDATGAPLGGNSITEASFEARYRFKAFGNDIGLVPFIDVGQVYTSTLPRFDSLRIGAGLGLRYYTSFGPVRIDVATPVTRNKFDSAVAFYVSIGQAF